MSNGEAPEKKSNVLLWVVLGCGGALALVVILGIVAAIVIPGCAGPRMRAGGNETNTVGSCRAYAEAQIMFHRNDWDNDAEMEYAAKLPELANTKDATGVPIQLIDSALAAAYGSGAPPKYGYVFKEMKTIGGVKINWVDDYALCAIPAQYGKTGRRTFIVNTNGTVFGKDLGPAGTFVDDYPGNPTVAGWIIAE